MAVYHFNETVVWSGLGTFVRFAGGLRSISVRKPDATSATVVQNGVTQVGFLLADANGRVEFTTTDIPTVILDFGAGPLTINSAEAVSAGAASAAAAAGSATSASGSASSAAASAAAASASLGTKVDKGALVVNVKDYGALGDGVADDTAAIAAAVTAIGSPYRTLYFPSGTYRHSATIIAQNISGDGLDRTTLTYTGTGTAVKPGSTPGVRSYRAAYDGFSVTAATPGGPSIGIDLDAHTAGLFSRIKISGFQDGFSLRSLGSHGWTLYNTFQACEVSSCGNGWLLTNAANENRFIACRSNMASGWAVRILGGNHNVFMACAFESGTSGVYIDALDDQSGRNQFAFCRLENNSTDAFRIGAGVEQTVLLFNDMVSTGGGIVDAGSATIQIGSDFAAPDITRTKGMGADTTTPVFAVRDTYGGSGSPTTMLIENPRFGGKFLSGTASGVELFAVTATGAVRPRASVTGSRPSASASGAGAMVYDTTLSKPIWSNGSVWKDATGTTV